MIIKRYRNQQNQFMQKVIISLISYWNIYVNNQCDQLFNHITYSLLYRFHTSFIDELDERFNPTGSIHAEKSVAMMEEDPVEVKRR